MITNNSFSGKEDILAFKQENPEIVHGWRRIYTKIFNEKASMKRRAEKRLQAMKH